jgi:hypothetical protein
MVLNDWNNL